MIRSFSRTDPLYAAGGVQKSNWTVELMPCVKAYRGPTEGVLWRGTSLRRERVSLRRFLGNANASAGCRVQRNDARLRSGLSAGG